MPAFVWPLFQAVVDDVGPDDGGFEDPAVGHVPAESCTKDASSRKSLVLEDALDAGAKPILGRSSFVPALPLRGQLR
jgi:hypothetical protein